MGLQVLVLFRQSSLLVLAAQSLSAILIFWSLYHLVVYPLFLSSLRHVPGPKFAALSSCCLDYQYFFETGIPYVQALHRKYGPIVRVGPSEVVVNDPEQLPILYGIRSRLSKPPTTALFDNYGCPNAFSSVTRDQHRQRRRVTAKVYTMSSLQNNDSLMAWIQNRLDLVERVVDSHLGKILDILPLATGFALDNVSFQVYGNSLDLLQGQNLQATEDTRNGNIAAVPLVRFPLAIRIISVWPLTFLMPGFLRKASVSHKSIEATNLEQIEIATNSAKLDPEKSTLGFIRSQAEHDTTITDGHVASECIDHVIAGADTTSASIIYMFHELSQPENLVYQSKLREEISELRLPLDFKHVCNLPYLNSCVYEILRLHPPGPGSLQQRWTTEETAVNIDGQTYHIPANTLIGIQAQSLHRSERVFGKDADKFQPERWEDKDELHVRKMKDAWIPFGSGARTCLGMSLAIIELKVIVATLLRGRCVELPPDANLEDMSPVFAGVIRPRAGKCELVFGKISPFV